MGKAAKAHRAKVAKRNANMKLQEKKMQKIWQEAFEEQMSKLKEQLVSISGETMSGDTKDQLSNLLENNQNQDETLNEFSEIFTKEEGMKLAEKNYQILKENLGEEMQNKLKKSLIETVKEIKDEIEQQEEDEFNKMDLVEKLKFLKEEFDDIIPKIDNEEIETHKKFEELLKTFEIENDQKEETTREESEPTEPVSGE